MGVVPAVPDIWGGEDGTGACRLSSHFQPIFSLAHRKPVGHEGLIRAVDAQGRPLPPLELFATAPLGEPRILLDRKCRELHVRNFLDAGEPCSWLFLNVDPYVATEGRNFGSFFSQMLASHGMAPHRIAVELIESQVEDEQRLATAVEYYRELGCLIVIDDFGAGHSNFDRIWRLRPDLVKIDREMTRRVSAEPLARRMFTGIVQLLHEAGALVCVEGIETETEALCAIDADADLVQGYYFAQPAAALAHAAACRSRFTRLFAEFHAGIGELQDRRQTTLQPYIRALEDVVWERSAGAEYASAVRPLLALDHVQRCYLIAGDGAQIGPNMEAPRNPHARDPRLEPMRPDGGTNWQNRPYFRRALEMPGRIQITRPYMSSTGPRLCVTLSLAFAVADGLQVLCADLDFEALAGENLAFGAGRRAAS